jgi:hypothetical protein
MLQLHTRGGIRHTADYFCLWGNLVILLTGRLMPVDFPPVTEDPRTRKLEIYFTDRTLAGKPTRFYSRVRLARRLTFREQVSN